MGLLLLLVLLKLNVDVKALYQQRVWAGTEHHEQHVLSILSKKKSKVTG